MHENPLRSLSVWIVAGLLASAGGMARAVDFSREGADTPAELRSDLAAYRSALRKAVDVGGSVEQLGLRLNLFPNAWHQAAFERLAERLGYGEGLASEDGLKTVLAELRAVKPGLRKRLERHAAFRLDFIHLGHRADAEPDDGQPVHFFSARLEQAVRLWLGSKSVPWQGWKKVNLEYLQRLRLARHYTVKRGQFVAYTSPVKPTIARFVFRGREASLYGLLPLALLKRKHGRLLVKVSYEELTGRYDDQHIVDLNDAGNVWSQDLGATLNGELPFHFPPLPKSLERFLQRIDAPSPPEAPPTPGPGGK